MMTSVNYKGASHFNGYQVSSVFGMAWDRLLLPSQIYCNIPQSLQEHFELVWVFYSWPRPLLSTSLLLYYSQSPIQSTLSHTLSNDLESTTITSAIRTVTDYQHFKLYDGTYAVARVRCDSSEIDLGPIPVTSRELLSSLPHFCCLPPN
jgi:hypothetical protein